jgi:hypothetical protein
MTDDVHFRIGEIGGRVVALEQRVDRHELFMSERIRGVEESLKSVDSKLDGISGLISEQKGGADFRAGMLKFLVGFSGAAVAIAGGIIAWIQHGGSIRG